ncbi:S9 family peptidase [Daejeonella lutea]|uniref:Dipeptidyl aminopeptidase/acylaminoacyl peptidase n=1 Tax=Daejeonella lutea TaxID=572036 RepID=A0A1T5DSZ0_9SPHI|nr:prolyl oligopeptidase family serine peptidase [Daejeonella lutea]SKB74814.1 Dipeptidyl aminopeptidase/acylaminoacyl peptidase [Daejeonella lutea]
MKRLLVVFFLLSSAAVFAQQLGPLTVDKIMRDPKWMGVAPTNIQWDENSKTIYFNWNPQKMENDGLFQISTLKKNPEKVGDDIRRNLERGTLTYSRDRSKILFERNGDIVVKNILNGLETALVTTVEREANAAFSKDESKVIFQRGDNLYSVGIDKGNFIQLSNFTRTRSRPAAPVTKQDEWLRKDQLNEFDIIKKKDADRNNAEKKSKEDAVKRPKEFYLDERSTVNSIRISPDERYIVFRVSKNPEGNKNIIVPNYVTASGYTEDINGRTKVGNTLPTFESYVYDITRDSIYLISTKEIPGIKDLPDYVKDYPEQLAERTKKNEDRKVSISGPFWNSDGSNAVVTVTSLDNKDRWIMKLDPGSGRLSLLDRQRDEAWIGGPGINSFNGGSLGWIDNNTFYFQSEASGYSHLYTVNVNTNLKKQLTAGKFEVQTLRLSNDKKSFYFTGNIEHPGITHLYRIPVAGGEPVKITSMRGGNEVSISPDEKWLAIRYSYANKPWELFLQENKPGAKAEQITNSLSEEFKSYPWKDPELVSFKNRFGSDVYARIYKPQKADPSKPAVLFVHGAGYLQNVHYWWSQYFREYMFNNLLSDMGYTVIDVDYTGSSGYGRDHRTGIYRHMGGKDLSDHVDAVKLLVEKYGVNPANVGLYGGSYGGFITLMGLFTEPEVFKSGAGLRSVTDWAHYNHGYTSNILNEPYTDEKSYKKSSPIYFAEGLKGNLLMAHGMVDVNVNFQDIVRLSQRLIELKKDNWELAVYPVEDHAFTEPSSWTDEYKRILKLFETTLKTK